MTVKTSTLFLFSFFGLACSSSKIRVIEIDQDIAKEKFKNINKAVVLSCVSCGCFKPEINKINKKYPGFWSSVNFFSDTSCSKLEFKGNYIKQRVIDSLSDELFNVVLIKKENGKYLSRIVDTKESPKLYSITKKFFEVTD